MSTLTQTIKRNAYAAAALVIALAAVLPSVILAQLTSAAQMTSRQITMSSAAPSASSVTYQVSFDVDQGGTLESVIVDFCDESPIIGATCTLPTGMTVGTSSLDISIDDGGGATPATGYTASTLQSGKTLQVENATTAVTVSQGDTVIVTVSGFVNPSDSDGQTFYARMLTYADSTVADGYVSSPEASVPAYLDAGGVALATVESIGVSATVQESLTFCVSGLAPSAGCTGSITAPDLTLGQGTPRVLDSSTVSSDTVHFQLSTNAAGDTSVFMKGASGDLQSGSSTIPARGATAGTLTAGTAGQFGARVGTPSGGSGTIAAEAPYDGALNNYAMDDTNVSSTYGDLIALASGPVSDRNMPVTFAAIAGSATPAGVYTASFSLIAASSY